MNSTINDCQVYAVLITEEGAPIIGWQQDLPSTINYGQSGTINFLLENSLFDIFQNSTDSQNSLIVFVQNIRTKEIFLINEIPLSEVSLSSNEVAHIPEIEIYPNPTQKNLTINPNFRNSMPSKIIIYNLKGQKIYTENISSERKDIKIDLTNLNFSSGVYFLSFQNKKTSQIKKFLYLK